ncbi:cytochrome P450 4C1-like [Planococcus citri]|uniref:cytochrome P450 4C1-like n=1 Tax=Planococcus citri TaxID=170843 RepID=UPI0031F94224
MNVTAVFVCLTVIVILFRFLHKMKNKRLYELLEQFPSYPTYPLIGNAHLLFGAYNDLLLKSEQLLQPHDRLVFWVGPIPCLVLKKYNDILTMLNQSLDRDSLHVADEWAGIGLLTAEYEEWKKSRKMLAPAFSSDMLTKYVDVFHEKASNFVEKLKPVVDTDVEVDVLDYVLNTNLDAIVENTMGISMESTGKRGEEFCTALLDGFISVTERLLSPWLHPHFIYMLYLRLTGKIESIKRLQYLPSKILRDNLNDSHNQKIEPDGVDSSRTVIDLLIKRRLKEPGFTETRTRDELLQIILAGVETTALNMSYLMLMLAIHQDVQQKVYEEITQLVSEDETITAVQLFHQLKYLDQCIRETTRMYSPVTITGRRTHKECVLKDNTIVPANMLVMAVIHLAHHDPELYRNPNKWDPENFSEEAIAERPKGSCQLSFGFGPRSCIGARYAMLSVKTQITHILRNYHLSTHVKELTNDDLKMDLMIRNKIGYPIKFTSRQKVKV